VLGLSACRATPATRGWNVAVTVLAAVIVNEQEAWEAAVVQPAHDTNSAAGLELGVATRVTGAP